jgi:hypothetical protein
MNSRYMINNKPAIEHTTQTIRLYLLLVKNTPDKDLNLIRHLKMILRTRNQMHKTELQT